MENLQRITTIFYDKAKDATTDTGIIDAAKSASDGKPELLADQMFSLAEYKHINITAALETYRSETAEAKDAAEKQRQAQKTIETAENIKTHIEALTARLKETPNINAPELHEKYTAINSLAAALINTADTKSIFPALTDIYAEWDAYDPEKDFRPPLLAGAAIKDGTLSYIGARTNIGKTTALINLTREGLTAGRKVIFLTLEEPARDILRKLILCDLYARATDQERDTLQQLAKDKGDLTADFHAARKGYVKGEKETAMLFKKWVLEAQEKITGLYGSRLIFCEGRNISTLEQTAAAITKHAGPGDIVLVDFIQRLKGPPEITNYMKGKAQSDALFNISKNTGAAVISGAQFNRATKDIPRELAPLGYKPFDETCFREAGDIEQDGDYLFGIGETIDTEAAGRYIKILKVRSGAGRGRCYAIDFQGAYNYMGIGERLTQMNPAYETRPTGGKKKQQATDRAAPPPGWGEPPENDDSEPVPF
jgi:hypothetical protein